MPDRHEQTVLDVEDTEYVSGAVPAATEPANAARWAYYASLRSAGAEAVCIPAQLVHCFNHPLDRTCVCGRVKAVSR